MTTLAQRNRRVATRARPLASKLTGWLQRFARVVLERELSRVMRKADDEERLRDELAQLLRMFGMRQMGDAASGVRRDVVIEPRAILDFLATKDVLVQGLVTETRDRIREDIKRVIAEGLAEQPQPSPGELARRIRSSYFGPEDARPFAVSSERAALIARTELAQAENTGIVEGYKATGVEEIEWLAYSDGSSGDRHHEQMDGERVKLGEFFVTPLGNRLRYPGDPAGPIKETANCRCTVVPVRTRN